ncbi:MAG: hypothetical protein ABL866_14115 [Devosia sp.]
MATIFWPASLPRCALRGKQRSPAPNVIAFGTEVGPGKVRRRSTARIRRMTLPFLLTRAEVPIFEAFFEDDLKDGALEFSMNDPVTGDGATWRFATDNPYALSERGSGKWDLTANLEKQP